MKGVQITYCLSQYNNPCNPLAHFDGTAEEILWSLDDDVDMVVMGAGTCGTISGVAHKIKERCPRCVVVGVDPYGSILAQPEHMNETDVQIYEVGKNTVVLNCFVNKQLKTYIFFNYIFRSTKIV